MFYVNTRWLGGTLTNFSTIRKSIHRLKEIEGVLGAGGQREPDQEGARCGSSARRRSSQKNLTGIKEMDELPDALFVIDPKQEYIAVKEANILGIPVVAVVDTNCDPDVDRPRDPGQRRRDPRDPAVHARGSPTRSSRGCTPTRSGRPTRRASEESRRARPELLHDRGRRGRRLLRSCPL